MKKVLFGPFPEGKKLPPMEHSFLLYCFPIHVGISQAHALTVGGLVESIVNSMESHPLYLCKLQPYMRLPCYIALESCFLLFESTT